MSFIKKTVIASFVFEALIGGSSSAIASQISAQAIYQQASVGNVSYFQLLSRYRNMIDVTDAQGNTAYCLAVKNHDTVAQSVLFEYGANPYHPCNNEVKKSRSTETASREKVGPRKKFKDDSLFSGNSKRYMLAGAGLLAVGGGVALAMSGGGGGGGHGQASGAEPVGSLSPNNASKFRTAEYMAGNFLDGIKGAEAYSYIYGTDESGKLFGHQAGSDKALEKIKVGIFDNGVYPNVDLDGKVVKRYDINEYSGERSVWSYMRQDGSLQAYVVKKGSKYYLFHIHREKDAFGEYYNVFEPVNYGQNGDRLDWAVDEKDLADVMQQAWKISLSDMSLVNAGTGYPGEDLSELDPDLPISDLVSLWAGTINGMNHGSHVAGIIAGNKNDQGMHGVAFDNAQIEGVSWDLSTDMYGTVKNMVDNGVRVFNNSWGVAVPLPQQGVEVSLIFLGKDVVDSYIYAAKNKAVWVQSAGNEAMNQPSLDAALGFINLNTDGYVKGDTEVPYLSVVALDYGTKSATATSGEIAWYSNACGSASGFCLAAPGSDILSTGASKEGNVYLSGTSMAAPVVSGSIALLNGYYPWLNAQNVAYLLLETANNKGVYANSAVYGRGALDLEAAVTTPLGELKLPENSSFDSLSSAKASKLSLSTPLQQKMLKAMPETVTAFDILNRPFQYDTAKLVNITHASNANLRNAVSKIATGGAKRVIKDEKTGFQFSSEETLSRGGKAGFSSAEVVSETADSSTRLYYAANSKYATGDNVLRDVSNPYFAMNEAYGAENTFKLSNASKVKFSIQTGENGLYERDYEQDKHSFDKRAYSFAGEYGFNLTDYLEVATLGGMLFEDEAMLGMNGTGMFGIKDSSTYYMGVRAALNLTPDFSIVAAYYRGYTKGSETSMLALSDLQTESFMLAGEYKLNAKDKIGLSLSSPLSVVKGRASVLFANGRDSYSDTIYMQKLTTSLKPEAKEYDLGLYYQGQPKEDVNLMGKIQARFNADGEKGVTDYMGIVGAGISF